jgi:hypothetical protein
MRVDNLSFRKIRRPTNKREGKRHKSIGCEGDKAKMMGLQRENAKDNMTKQTRPRSGSVVNPQTALQQSSRMDN